MNIKLELLKSEISELVTSKIDNLEIDADKITDTLSTSILSQILTAIKDDNLSDFEVAEKS